MSKAKQLLEDIDYLESVGLTVAQLRRLHHWGGDPAREARITFASTRNYFAKDQEMLENNTSFADRVHLVAEVHRQGLPAIVELALSQIPREPSKGAIAK